MSVEELNAQIEELKTTNQDLQTKLEAALDKIKTFEDEEKIDLIASIVERSEVAADELDEKSVTELKAIDAVLDKAKVNYKGVKPGTDDRGVEEPGKLTVGRWDADAGKWVN